MWQNCNLKMGAIALVAIAAICGETQPSRAIEAKTRNPIGRVEIKQVKAINQYQQGLNSLAAGKFKQALFEFDRAIELDPEYIQAYIERGNTKDAIRDLPGAYADFSKAITLDPKSAPAYYNRGTISTKIGKHQAAIADFTAAISIDPKYAAAYMNRGNNYDDLGNSIAAFADYDRAIALKPNYALAYINRGIAYERAGKRSKAIADLQFAAKLFKANGDLYKYQSALEIIQAVLLDSKRK